MSMGDGKNRECRAAATRHCLQRNSRFADSEATSEEDLRRLEATNGVGP